MKIVLINIKNNVLMNNSVCIIFSANFVVIAILIYQNLLYLYKVCFIFSRKLTRLVNKALHVEAARICVKYQHVNSRDSPIDSPVRLYASLITGRAIIPANLRNLSVRPAKTKMELKRAVLLSYRRCVKIASE